MPDTHELTYDSQPKIREKIDIVEREIGELEEMYRKSDREQDKRIIQNLLNDANLRLDTYFQDLFAEEPPIENMPQITGDYISEEQPEITIAQAPTPPEMERPQMTLNDLSDLTELMERIERNNELIQQLAMPSPNELIQEFAE